MKLNNAWQVRMNGGLIGRIGRQVDLYRRSWGQHLRLLTLLGGLLALLTLPGCLSSGRFVPPSASEKTGHELVGGGYAFNFLAPADGTVYVYESGDYNKKKAPLMSFTVRRGDKLSFSQEQIKQHISAPADEAVLTEVWFIR